MLVGTTISYTVLTPRSRAPARLTRVAYWSATGRIEVVIFVTGISHHQHRAQGLVTSPVISFWVGSVVGSLDRSVRWRRRFPPAASGVSLPRGRSGRSGGGTASASSKVGFRYGNDGISSPLVYFAVDFRTTPYRLCRRLFAAEQGLPKGEGVGEPQVNLVKVAAVEQSLPAKRREGSELAFFPCRSRRGAKAEGKANASRIQGQEKHRGLDPPCTGLPPWAA